MNRLAVIILAAGKGKRMKSPIPKVLHLLSGKPILSYVINLARELNPERIAVVIGHGAEKVKEWARGKPAPASSKQGGQGARDRIEFVEQKEQLGTGHAVMQTMNTLKNFDGDILILSGDVPLLKASTVHKLIKVHRESDAIITVLTTKINNPEGYGRIVKNETGSIVNIIEEKDASLKVKGIREINSGIYCFKKDFLFNLLKRLNRNNVQQEYYLTDAVDIAFKSGLKIGSLVVEDPYEVMGINTQEELKNANIKYQKLKLRN
jgi:UDP-N-acetylglucosamine diphosphorylase/glucosamine-1-phosphate N-acetyltransferase